MESVTQYVKRHAQPFDTEFHAENYARKTGMQKEDVIKMWQEKGQRACLVGTHTHKIIETYCKTKRIEIVSDIAKKEAALKFIEAIQTGEYTPFEVEYEVKGRYLVGHIDMVAKDKAGNFVIIDFKTNEKISTYSFGKSMLDPYGYLPDAAYYHYSLQLSLYRKLCVKYPISKCLIVHLREKDFKIIEAQYIFKNQHINT